MANNVKAVLNELSTVDGYVGACIVDAESAMSLGVNGGGGLNLEVAAAGNAEVVKAKLKTIKRLGLREGIEDILITLNKQYHLIRPSTAREGIFIYLAVDRAHANLAMARFQLADAERSLQL